MWAAFWRFEDGAQTPVAEYAVFMVLTTVAYAVGLAVWWRFRTGSVPSLRGSAAAMVVLAALAVAHAVANPLSLIGVALVAVALVAVARTRTVGDVPLLATAGPAPWRALWRLVIVPVVATAAFALVTSTPEPIPTGWLFLIVTVPLTTVMFVIAWWRSRSPIRGLGG